jgi:phosphate-selective porin OprO/OprP
MPWSEAQPLQAPLPDKLQERKKIDPSNQEYLQSLEERLKELEQKSRITERLRELDQELAQQKVKETPVVGAGSEGFFLRSADRTFEIKLRGYLQMDGRFFFDNSNNSTQPNPNTLEIRRARPIIEGILFRYFDFKFMPDFGQGQTTLVDGYLGFNYWPQFQIRAGKFKPPVGLEMQQSATDTLFIERGLPINLLPNRDIGIQLYGDVLAKRLTYQVGVFNGARDNTTTTDFDENNGKDFAARIFALPFLNHSTDWLKGLGIGIGGSYGSTKGQLSNFRIPAQGNGGIDFFAYRNGVTAAGDRFRISPQLYYAWGSFGLLGEYAYNSQEVQKETNLDTLHHQAWQLAASYVLTGENASFKGVKPWRKFNPSQGAWGALELKARYNELHVDSNAFPIFADPTQSVHSIQAWAVGINWYLMPNIKAMLDYEEGYFKGGAISGDRATERALMTRLQVAF